MVKYLKGKSYKEQISSLHLFSSEMKRQRGALITPCSFPKRQGEMLIFSSMTRHRSQGNGMKLGQGKLRQDIRKRFSLRGWLATGKGSSGNWSQCQVWQSSRSIWTMVLVTWFSFRESVRSRELGSILMGPFQLGIFYDPLTPGLSSTFQADSKNTK